MRKYAKQVKNRCNGYEFSEKYRYLLYQSFTHIQFSNSLSKSKNLNENLEAHRDKIAQANYERTEFFGDALLNFTVAKVFYMDTAKAK